MKRYQVVLLAKAREDIERNAQWWAEAHSVDQAIRWSEQVREQLQTLQILPERHALSAENADHPIKIRDKAVGLGARPGFRAIFTVRESTVVVLAVRRASQARLEPDELTGF